MDLSGRTAVVTGGGTGIGRAICLDLARAGIAAIAVNYSRSETEAEATAATVRELGAEAITVKADVAEDGDCRALVAAAVAEFGRLDVLVNNAGTTHFIPHANLGGITAEVWNDIFRVNVQGTFQCSRAAAEELRKRRGAIVNVSSIAGWRPSGSSIAYGVSKAGLTHLTRFLASTLAPDVRVNSVSPGLIATRWFRKPFGEESAAAQEAVFASSAPLGATPGPEHVAQAVMGLLGMDMVTGADVIVDAGMHLVYGPASGARRA